MVNPIGPSSRPIYNPDVDQTKGGGHTHSSQPSQSTGHSHSTGASTPTATPAVTQAPQTQESHGHGGGHKGNLNKIQDVTAPAVKKSWRGQFAMMRNGAEETRKKVMQEIKDMEKAKRLFRKKEGDQQQNKKNPKEDQKTKKNPKK